MEEAKLETMKFEFSQSGNTCGTTEEFENLIIECESSLGIDSDKDWFYVIRTKGWSFDSIDELSKLIDRLESIKEKSLCVK